MCPDYTQLNKSLGLALSFIVSTSSGTSVDLKGFANNITIQAATSSATLSGSFDGTHWFDMGVVTSSDSVDNSCSGSTDINSPNPPPSARFVRVNTSGTVSVSICVTDVSAFTATSLIGASTVPTTGSVTDLLGTTRDVTVLVTPNGSVSSVGVELDGSLDGTNWFHAAHAPSTGAITASFGHPSPTRPPHMRYVRARLVQLSGDTGRSVDVSICVNGVN